MARRGSQEDFAELVAAAYAAHVQKHRGTPPPPLLPSRPCLTEREARDAAIKRGKKALTRLTQELAQ